MLEGRDHLLLREYARSKLHGGDVVRDFAAMALPDLDTSGSDFGRHGENAALSGVHLTAYRTINRILPYSDGKGGLRKGNARAKRVVRTVLAPVAPKLKRHALSPEEHAVGVAIAARFAASNHRLSEAFFGGSLFTDAAQSNIEHPVRATN